MNKGGDGTDLGLPYSHCVAAKYNHRPILLRALGLLPPTSHRGVHGLSLALAIRDGQVQEGTCHMPSNVAE